ncbi:MAG TPA: hypothetical protein VG370_35035 [Chloroflexota bacterium]|jgi:hypothetical protein|nr:hypothetical protein [Chloroflexota bacterium]
MAVMSGGRVIEGAQARGGALSAEATAGAPAVYGAIRGVRARYDFAADGGAVGTIGLVGSAVIPSGAVVLGGFVDVVTPPTSGGAGTVAVQVEAAGDVVAAAAVSGAPWSTAGRKSVIPVFTGASSLKTTAARDVSAVIAAADLTAGVFDVYLFYVATA